MFGKKGRGFSKSLRFCYAYYKVTLLLTRKGEVNFVSLARGRLGKYFLKHPSPKSGEELYQ